MADKDDSDMIAKALGASRVVKLRKGLSGGPLEWLHLAQILQDRLISKG